VWCGAGWNRLLQSAHRGAREAAEEEAEYSSPAPRPMSARPLPRGASQKGVRPASAKPDVNRGFVPRERTDFNELPGVVSEDTLGASTEWRADGDSTQKSIEHELDEQPDELLDDDALARLDMEERRRSEGGLEAAEPHAGAAAAYVMSTEVEAEAEEVLSPTRAEELRRVAAEAEAETRDASDQSATPVSTGWFSSMMSACKRLVFGKKDKVGGQACSRDGHRRVLRARSERERLARAVDSLLARRRAGWRGRRQASALLSTLLVCVCV
jgi:hypothetical protein